MRYEPNTGVAIRDQAFATEPPADLGYRVPPPPLPHSRLGAASIALAALTTLVVVALFAFMGYKEMQSPGYLDEESPEDLLLGLILIGSMMAALVGLVLGVVGLFYSDRRRLLAVLGTCFCGLIFFGLVGLMIVASIFA